ncbi:MAG: DEAD/DEAH box helicase [Desulfobacterales bacterium]|jgi:ATP-dependent RNA helicase RhlB|nr:MAG: DEAD/DEAH box helicase [Desulfobacterales bacterium]
MKSLDTKTEDVLFTEFDLPPEVLRGIDSAGFTHCTPIQAMALPITLKGNDIAAQAQTGTGKTATFLITIFDHLIRKRRAKDAGPRALIIAPTRELTVQICEEAKLLGSHTDYRVLPVFGGIDYVKQQKALRSGTDIVVATPGRLIDYMKQKVFNPKNVRILVIDEADRLFDMGFIQDLRFILRRLPRYTMRQSMLFSATLSYAVMELAYAYMNNPEEVSVDPQKITVEEIDQVLYHVGNNVKLNLLLGLLNRERWNRLLIFANTRIGVEMLTRKLKDNGFAAVGITGTVDQKKRLKIMQRFKGGEVKILVATDVASRGIHVEDIDIVINYDVPQDPEDYVHRIGRTGRLGKSGKAITLACERYVYHLEAAEKLIGEKINVAWAEDGWYEKDRARPPRPRRKRRKSRRAAPSSMSTRRKRVAKGAPHTKS